MFFDRLGLKKLRFKPAYNPYTEPSMEIFRLGPIESLALFCMCLGPCVQRRGMITIAAGDLSDKRFMPDELFRAWWVA